jgi:NADP-dependent alcohol dehydrogenase
LKNFDFCNPTKILFGRGKIAEIAKELPDDANVLVTYGGGSIHANGVYDQVAAALGRRRWQAFGGIEPNPSYETLMTAVDVVRRDQVTMLLAVGGGSVADGTKFIGAAARFEGEPWDIMSKGAEIASAVPLGVVLTLPATGSESNNVAVISRIATREKLAFASAHSYPRFAVLDPETTYSLPVRQVGNGVVDAFVHTVEQYLTYPADAPLQDRLAEAILQTLIEVGPEVLRQPPDYNSRATLMWSATLALNGLIGCGVPQDWATHVIGHEITALYGLDHAQTLAVVLPGLWRHRKDEKRAKLLQLARRVWGIELLDEEVAIEQAIRRTEDFFESMGVATRLGNYGVDGPEAAASVSSRLDARGASALGERESVTPDVVREVLLARA